MRTIFREHFVRMYEATVRELGIIDNVSKGLYLLGGFLIFILGIFIFVGSLSRYFFGKPISQIFEITGYLMYAVPLLAAPWILKLDRHVCVDVLVDSLSESKKNLLQLLNYFISLLVSLALFLLSSYLTYDQYLRGVRLLDTIEPPRYILTLIIPISTLLLSIILIKKIYGTLLKIKLNISN